MSILNDTGWFHLPPILPHLHTYIHCANHIQLHVINGVRDYKKETPTQALNPSTATATSHSGSKLVVW